jgi:hypothetical protein
MAVPFAKVVITLPKDRRIRRVGVMGELLYIRCLLLAKECMSNGEIDDPQLDIAAVGIPGNPRKLAEKLVEAGLWEKTETGWRVPPLKWAKYQTTKEQVEEKSRKRSEAGKKGAEARWQNGKPDGKLPSTSHDVAISGGMPPETRDQRPEIKVKTTYPPPIPVAISKPSGPPAELEAFLKSISFPKELDDQVSRSAVADWVRHRQGRGYGTTVIQVEKQLTAWVVRGSAAFAAAIDWSIGQGEAGVKEPPQIRVFSTASTAVQKPLTDVERRFHAESKP